MESIFTLEAQEKHLLKPMCIWKGMADSVNKVSKELGTYMRTLQHHSRNFDSWELEDITVWMKQCEILLQDLLHSGYTDYMPMTAS